MSVSTDQKIAASYVAFFNRAPEQGGLDFWRAEAASSGLSDLDLMKELAAGFSQHPSFASMYGNLSNSAFIDAIYVNVGGAPADAAGKAYWLAELAGGMSRSDFVASFVYGLLELDRDQLSSMLASGEISQQEFDNAVLRQDRMMNKAEVALLYTETMGAKSNLADWTDPLDPASLADDKAYQAAVAIIANVTELDSTKVQPVGLLAGDPSVSYLLDQLVGDGDARVFTLKETYAADVEGTPPVTAVYWGYNPHGHGESGVDNEAGGNTNGDTNEGPYDGGIPVSELLSFLTTITGLDLAELGLIDDDGVGPFDNVTNLELKLGDVEVEVEDSEEVGNGAGNNGGNGGLLTIYFADGTSKNAEVELGSEYFNFLNNLLFDAEGNSRLFERVIVPGTEGYAGGQIPIVLTPDQNNGGTVEPSHLRTTDGDDTIVAGRLELLHGAYINAGEGYNILEVDAKGVFAQPRQLLNIQEVRVNNLPNVYTEVDSYGSGDYVGDDYPVVHDEEKGAYANSILDLSRATSIEKLIVTESSFDGFNYTDSPGSLTIAGIRNGATARLEGAFTEDLYLHYGQGLTGPLTVELLIGQITADLNFAHNTDALHLVSLGGSANSFGSEDLGGRLTNLKISGDAALYINGDLDSSFQDETPITIDASENTGGVDLNLGDSEQVTFIGSSGNDRLVVDTDFADEENDGDQNFDNDQYVNIVGGEGNNSYTVETYKLTGTNGDGNNNYEFEAIEAELTLGDGDNHLEGHTVNFNAVVGDGDNRFDIEAFDSPQSNVWTFIDDLDTSVTIEAGDGKNVINVYANSQTLFADGNTESSFFNGHYLKPANINITAGNGGNTILIPALPFNDEDDVLSTVDITTGTGNDNIFVGGSDIKIASGGGNDTITLLGVDSDYAWDEYDTDTQGTGDDLGNYVPGSPETFTGGAVLDIDTGAGAARINLGNYAGSAFDYSGQNGVIIAKEGSSITGENITLFVNTYANLMAAELTGITSVILDDDAFGHTGAPQANDDYAGDRAFITLTDQQFAAIGADNFSVQGAIFNTHAFVKIIVTESTSLTALGVDDLPRNIDLYLEIQDGVTLTMTAEQLHTRVARDGITLSQDGNTDYAAGKVVITGGGTNFDPFNESDTIQTVINGNIYYGGSLSNDFKVGNAWYNVVVNSVVGGYDRPADAVVEVVLTINSDVQSEIGAFATWHSNLEIVGEQDVDFTGAVQLGMNLGTPVTPFTIDFSALEGVVNNFVVDNFELLAQGGGIYGNSNAGYASEVLISIAADEEVQGSGDSHTNENFGWDEDGASSLVSQGVSQYTVVQIDGPTAAGSEGHTATIQLCDTVEDLEVIALRGNWNDTLNIVDAAWGLAFELQGGGTAKAEGPTGTSNVGALVANYEWEGADAVVNITHANASDTRPIYAAGIEINNADSITINADGPAAIIQEIDGDDATSLTFTAEGSITVVEELDDDVVDIDASGVVGEFTVTIDNADTDYTGAFSFVGSQGGTFLTLQEFESGPGTVIDGGTGGGTLIIGDGTNNWPGNDDVDLSSATLSNFGTVMLHAGANLTLTMAQADAIGAGNIVLADDALEQLATSGGPVATLNLVGLGEEPFAIANYAPGIAVGIVSVIDQPVVTLHPDTDLTGIGALNVPEGVTLNLTAAQFQQLNGDGTINIINTDGDTSNDAITVNITDLTQADVDGGFELNDITVGEDGLLTVTLAEDVTFTEQGDWQLVDEDGNAPTFYVGDNLTLTLADVEQGDGLIVIGGDNSTLTFTDTFFGAFDSIDASGFGTTFLRLPNVLVANRNVDLMFLGLPESVTKVIYTGLGWVEGVNQFVEIEEGVTIPGWIVFNKPEAEFEIRHFTLTMQGGTEIDGNLRLSASDEEDGLIQTDLQSVTIISNSTADDVGTDEIVEGANRLTGNTANIIDGDLTSQGTGFQGSYTSVDNDLLEVNIEAEEDFILTGSIIFESVTGNDNIAANDDDEATATLNVSGSANVTIGDLNTGDDDVDFLVVNHSGTGTLTFGLSSLATIDDSDGITINGSADGMDIINISGTVNLSDDVLNNVDSIVLDESGGVSGSSADVSLTITQAQLVDIGAGNIVVNEDGQTAYLNINQFQGAVPFDATALDPAIDDVDIFMAPGVQTLDPSTNLTGVDTITVPEGGTLNLTAAQFQQLAGSGTIVGVEADGDPTSNFTVNITDLTQADVDNDLNGDGDSLDAGENFDLSAVTAATLTLSLAEDVDFNADDILGNVVEVLLADGQSVGLATFDQADDLTVTGGTDTSVYLRFDELSIADGGGTPTPGPLTNVLNVAGYNVSQLHALNTFVGGINVEYLIDDLASSVELVIYHDPEDLGFYSETHRVVTVEHDVTVPGQGGTSLGFNDLDLSTEVRTLTLNLMGGVLLDGDLRIGAATTTADPLAQFFQTLTIVSELDPDSVGNLQNPGQGTVNVINGDILPTSGGPFFDNNLLNVNIIADNELQIGSGGDGDGTIFFNALTADDDTATFNVSGTADVTLKALDITGFGGASGNITILNVVNNTTGVLTITGGSDAIEADGGEVLNFSGTGDIVLDTDDGVGNNGIEGDTLSFIDASGLSGDFTVGVIEDVDNDSFTFTSGTGVTTATFIDNDLDSTGGTPDPVTSDDGTGWTFDFSSAAPGSVLVFAPTAPAFVDDSSLSFNMGPDAILCIESSMDLSGLDLSYIGDQPIQLGADVEILLTAEQAAGLNIVPKPGLAPGDMPTVNVVGLGDDPVDLSGIDPAIAGYVFLEDDDVSLDPATDLGAFTVGLIANSSLDFDPSLGQTIRFSTVEQADGRDIEVIDGFSGFPVVIDDWAVPGDDANLTNSTNVAWLFDTIPGQLDTTGYDGAIGRLWVSAALVDSVGGNIENLFNSLPDTILRVDFNSVTELDILLASSAIDRIIELTSFTTIGGLIEIDDDVLPMEEHIQNLKLDMGGEVTVGNIVIGDIVAAPDTNPLTPEFETLQINSRVALDDDHYLATDDYVNDNLAPNVPGEHVQPVALNTLGDIMVGGTHPGIDLLDVVINTFGDSSAAAGTGNQVIGFAALPFSGNDGAALEVGTLTYDSEVAGETANLDVTGTNDVTFKSIDTTDADITALVIDLTQHTGTFTVTGGSPALAVGNTESVTINTGSYPFAGQPTNGDVNLGTAFDGVNNVPYAGVAGAELSHLTVGGDATVNLGVLAQIDSDDDLATDINGDGDMVDLNEHANDAFTLLGNDDTGGKTFATLGAANVNGVVTAPVLEDGSTWRFEDLTLTITEDTVFQAGAILELDDVHLIIVGDVDLSQVVLNFSDVDIQITDGSVLTVTPDQLVDDLNPNLIGDEIWGSGTLKLVGDATNFDDTGVGSLGYAVNSIGVDLSEVTIDLPTDTDDHVVFIPDGAPFDPGAIDDNGDPAGFNIIGSEFDDYIEGSNEADTIDGRGGDDEIYGGFGADVDDVLIGGEGDNLLVDSSGDTTFIADAGTNTATGIFGGVDTGDIVQVSAGAAIDAFIDTDGFVATADSFNDGDATLIGPDGTDVTIDMSLATGTNGWNIIGGANDSANTLIGSEQDDVINGGDGDQDGPEDADVLTGNGGDDTFEFDVSISTPADFQIITTGGSYDGEDAIDAEDYERLAVDPYTAGTFDSAALVISYRLNNVVTSINVPMGAVDETDENAVAAAVATALNSISGVNAMVDPLELDDIMINVDDGGSFEFLGVGPLPGFDIGDLDITEVGGGQDSDDTFDVEQISFVTVDFGGGTATAGERYNLTIELRDGTEIVTDDYIAVGGESAMDIRDEILDSLNAKLLLIGGPIVATAVDEGGDDFGIRLEGVADEGGFEITNFTASGAFEGSGASGDPDPVGDGLESADLITDFDQEGNDVIDLNLVAGAGGVSGNYDFATEQVDYATAYGLANATLGGDVVYFFTSIEATATEAAYWGGDQVNEGDTLGLLFFDANADGDADGVIALLGINDASFGAQDIIA